MAYIALYREWRPASFEDVVEQEHVVKALRYSVSNGRIAHAYLFCGTRGTGKTTMAHILSRAINCLNPNDGNPCNQCEVCREILAGSCVDVLEIDAASNNSVDDVRAIRDEVIYAPVKAKYKVYIIDEVHMLSSGAFNALLKTLEEPPEHVIFILATTEPHKLPATILSRCQRFDFRRITHESIVKQLKKIASAVGVALDLNAAKLIARMSDGAMRDAISLLDQCISIGSGKIGYDDVLSVVGIVNDTFMTDFVKSMLDKNVSAILDNVNRLVMDGRDIAHFVSDLVLYFRNLLICKATDGKCEGLVEAPSTVLEIMKQQTENISQDEIIHRVKELSALEASLKWASNQRVLLEVTLIKLSGSDSPMDSSISDRLAALEERVNKASASVLASSAPVTATPPVPVSACSTLAVAAAAVSANSIPSSNSTTTTATPVKPSGAETAAASSTEAEFRQWNDIMEYLKSIGRRTIHTFLLNVEAVRSDGNTISIIFNAKNRHTKTLVSKPEHIDLVEEAVLKVTGNAMKVKIMCEETPDKTPAKAKSTQNDMLVEKARDIANKAGLPLEILDE